MLAAGGSPARVVFSGVGKSEAEMRFALEHDILCFNVESASELERLNRVAATMGKVAPVSFRVNPDVDPGTHPYISTGLKEKQVRGAARGCLRALSVRARPARTCASSASTATSGRRSPSSPPYVDALDRILESRRPPGGGRHRSRAHRPGRRHRHPLPGRAAARAGGLCARHPRPHGGAAGTAHSRARPLSRRATAGCCSRASSISSTAKPGTLPSSTPR